MLVRRLLWSFGLLLGPATAFAQGTASPAEPNVVDDAEALPPLVPPAHDTLGGHFIIGASGMVAGPFGELQTGYAARDLGAGFGGMLDLGIGLSRNISIGLWGEGLAYSSSSACRFWHLPNAPRDPCSALSFTIGPFVRYHLMQGMRFDPWILLGPGYRSLSQETPNGTKRYGGIDYLHVVIGGDYYVTSGVGIGPWVGLDGGVFTTRPEPMCRAEACSGPGGPVAKTAWHTELVAGLRVVLDIPGK
jgi:hypothetical protein